MDNNISVPTLKRLPYYYNIVCNAISAGDQYISSAEIAKKLDVDDTQVRKDIAAIGYTGKPKVGFEVHEFKKQLENYLGFNEIRNAILVGAGNLGIALSRYEGFEKYGLKLVGLFDNDPAKIGLQIADKKICSMNNLSEILKKYNVEIAIITVPAIYAQNVTDLLVKSGIKAIWSFAPISLNVPDNVYVRTQDLAANFTTFVQMAHRKNVL
jgi:redox-sensing transcriptional repressor